MKSRSILTFSALACVGSLQAATVIQGVTATATSFWSPSQSPSNIVNNSGISVPYDITATHTADGSAFGQWHAREWANDPNPTFTFDLGGSFDLSGVHIWNGNQGIASNDLTARGVNAFTLSVSSNGVDYTNVLVNSSLTKSPFTVGFGPGLISAQDFDLTGQNNVSHVQLVVLSNHTGPNGDYTGLSEVMFTAVPIPEPSTGLLASLGALVLFRRRRSQASLPSVSSRYFAPSFTDHRVRGESCLIPNK